MYKTKTNKSSFWSINLSEYTLFRHFPNNLSLVEKCTKYSFQPQTKNCNTIRPLLSLSRFETGKFCAFWQLPIYPDRSNQKVNFLRNRVRKQLLPTLKLFFNLRIETLLLQFAEIVEAEDFYMNQTTNKLLKRFIQGNTQPHFFETETLFSPTCLCSCLQRTKPLLPLAAPLAFHRPKVDDRMQALRRKPMTQWVVQGKNKTTCFVRGKCPVDLEYFQPFNSSSSKRCDTFERLKNLIPLRGRAAVPKSWLPLREKSRQTWRTFDQSQRVNCSPFRSPLGERPEVDDWKAILKEKEVSNLFGGKSGVPSGGFSTLDYFGIKGQLYWNSFGKYKNSTVSNGDKVKKTKKVLQLAKDFSAQEMTGWKIYNSFQTFFWGYKFATTVPMGWSPSWERRRQAQKACELGNSSVSSAFPSRLTFSHRSKVFPLKGTTMNINGISELAASFPVRGLDIRGKKLSLNSNCKKMPTLLRSLIFLPVKQWKQGFFSAPKAFHFTNEIFDTLLLNEFSNFFTFQLYSPYFEGAVNLLASPQDALGNRIRSRAKPINSLYQRNKNKILAQPIKDGRAAKPINLQFISFRKIEKWCAFRPKILTTHKNTHILHPIFLFPRFSVPITTSFWMWNRKLELGKINYCTSGSSLSGLVPLGENEQSSPEGLLTFISSCIPKDKVIDCPLKGNANGNASLEGKANDRIGLLSSVALWPCLPGKPRVTAGNKSTSSIKRVECSLLNTSLKELPHSMSSPTRFLTKPRRKKNTIYLQAISELNISHNKKMNTIFIHKFFLRFNSLELKKKEIYWPIVLSFLPIALQRRIVKLFLLNQNWKNIRYSQIENFLAIKKNCSLQYPKF